MGNLAGSKYFCPLLLRDMPLKSGSRKKYAQAPVFTGASAF